MAENESTLARLSDSLRSVDFGPADPRSVLALLLETALRVSATEVQPVDQLSCPNCDAPTRSERTPYCGTDCREVAGFVRQFRGCVQEGSAFNEERQAALGQVLWHVLGGGYPARLTLIPEKGRERAFARTGGKCEICGAPATGVDHIGSACNRPINLRPVCQACTRTKPFLDPIFLERDEVASRLEEIASRAGSPLPIRCCDDPAEWDWRAFLAKRKGLVAS